MITYDELDEEQEKFERITGHPFSECTCLDCVDSDGELICSCRFDMYNFDGDCLLEK
ncbi:hypothetical protein KAR91_18855 [Candidatus Pacearchaeota archaeon]|nr:hypothetical protein [Candidatus Pacearchaeota archaeon]